MWECGRRVPFCLDLRDELGFLFLDPSAIQSLIEPARAGDREAIDQLFTHYAPIVRRGLRKMIGERYRRLLGDSDDAAQDALLVAFSKLDRFDPEQGGSFGGWLLRIAELEILVRLRAERTQKRGSGQVGHLESQANFSPEAGEPTPSQYARGHELEERLQECMEQMPEKEREALRLKRYLGLSHEEIRVELGLPSAGAARALLSRALARLAELLGNTDS